MGRGGSPLAVRQGVSLAVAVCAAPAAAIGFCWIRLVLNRTHRDCQRTAVDPSLFPSTDSASPPSPSSSGVPRSRCHPLPGRVTLWGATRCFPVSMHCCRTVLLLCPGSGGGCARGCRRAAG